MTKIISKFKNSLTGEVYQIGVGEGGAFEKQLELKQNKVDVSLNTTDKTIVGAINEVQRQAARGHLTMHGGEIVQKYAKGDDIKFTTIVENLPAGRYVVSCNLSSQTSSHPNNENYGYPSIVIYNSDGNAISKIDISQTGRQITLEVPATIKLCPVRDTALRIENGSIAPNNTDLHIEIDETYTFSNIWVLPAHQCDLTPSQLEKLLQLID